MVMTAARWVAEAMAYSTAAAAMAAHGGAAMADLAAMVGEVVMAAERSTPASAGRQKASQPMCQGICHQAWHGGS